MIEAMTLPEYLHLSQEVVSAIARLKEALKTADSPEEIELLAFRLTKRCTALSKAKCSDAGRHEIRNAAELVLQGKRLAFAVEMGNAGDLETPNAGSSRRGDAERGRRGYSG